MLLFPLHLARLQMSRRVLTFLFEFQKMVFLLFQHHFPGKLVFQMRKSRTILLPCLYNIFYESKFDVQRT